MMNIDELEINVKLLHRELEKLNKRINVEKEVYDIEMASAICNLDSKRVKFLMDEHEKNMIQFEGENETFGRRLEVLKKERDELCKTLGI